MTNRDSLSEYKVARFLIFSARRKFSAQMLVKSSAFSGNPGSDVSRATGPAMKTKMMGGVIFL